MKKNIILNIITLLFFSSLLNAQSINIEEKVIGIITSGNSPVIVTESNYFQLKKNEDDVWLKYYQKIYNDTTLINPNLELKNESNFFIIPIVDFDYSRRNFNKLTDRVLLKDIIIKDNFGNYILSTEGEKRIKSAINSSKE